MQGFPPAAFPPAALAADGSRFDTRRDSHVTAGRPGGRYTAFFQLSLSAALHFSVHRATSACAPPHHRAPVSTWMAQTGSASTEAYRRQEGESRRVRRLAGLSNPKLGFVVLVRGAVARLQRARPRARGDRLDRRLVNDTHTRRSSSHTSSSGAAAATRCAASNRTASTGSTIRAARGVSARAGAVRQAPRRTCCHHTP